MGDVAASGGYWISMASDAVIADPGTITGSIGVFAILPTAEGLMDKLAAHRRHHHHLAGRRLRPAPAAGPAAAGGAAVRRGRHLCALHRPGRAQARKRTPEQIDAVAQGRIWTGAQALERGLIDRTGSLDDALRTAAQLIKQPTPEGTRPRVRYLERELSRTDRLIASLADVVAPPLLDALSARLLPASPSSRPTRWPPRPPPRTWPRCACWARPRPRALGPRHRGPLPLQHALTPARRRPAAGADPPPLPAGRPASGAVVCSGFTRMTSITFAFKVAPTTTDAPAPAIGRPTEQTGDKPMRTHALAVSRSPAHALTSRPAPQALTPRLLALAVAAACAAPLGALAQQAAASPKPAETSPEVKELEAVVVTGTARREGAQAGGGLLHHHGHRGADQAGRAHQHGRHPQDRARRVRRDTGGQAAPTSACAASHAG
jgi:hypothetical protein